MVTAAGRKVLQKAIFSFWERIPRRKTGELQKILGERDVIADSDQGRSFRAFWDFLMSQARQEEYYQHPAVTEDVDKLLRKHRIPVP